ncbi:MAG: hypothetical protein EA409_02845 [Saprospirales bacterium]|nr:MAG: hypothetical protein EA409_02845 [Saprospirales bacterium]
MEENRFLEESYKIIPDLVEAFKAQQPKALEKLEQLYQLMISQLTKKDGIEFNSGFAALSYLGTKYCIDGALMYRLHIFRKFLETGRDHGQEEDWRSGLFAIGSAVAQLTHKPLPSELWEFEIPLSHFSKDKKWGMNYIARERVVHTGKIEEKGWVVLRVEKGGKSAFMDLTDSVFEKAVRNLLDLDVSNVVLLLREIRIDESGILHPSIVIVEPDFIMDVTAVASCVEAGGNFPAIHSLKKLLPRKSTKYIMAGHVANYFLDRLMEDPSLSFTELIKDAFTIDPVSFCALSDEDIRFIAAQAQGFYRNISALIRKHFLATGKQTAHFAIEPSYYSPGNGLQGRLDLLYRDQRLGRSEIYELKSGSTFRPNGYGINPSHYAQTMLYYLILKDIYPRNEVISAFIIYAKDSGKTLRFAPAVKTFQHRTLALRNELYIQELKMQQIDRICPDDFEKYLGLDVLCELSGFTGSDAKNVSQIWSSLSKLEKIYFLRFLAFISREFRNSKVNHGGAAEARSGLSALWLDSREEKESRFSVFSDLQLKADYSSDSNPRMVFSTEMTPQKLANFRIGDVVVLYTDQKGSGYAPFTQVYRGTLIELAASQLTVRLRSKLSESERPAVNANWTLEPDVLESGFRHYYHSLAEFIRAKPDKRSLWLGLRPPNVPSETSVRRFEGLTDEQNRVANKIIDAEDYFLLWGPPGTGKTSVMIRTLIDYLAGKENRRLLLLAYTNRAVDEICDVIKQLGDDFVKNTVRIGSRYSCNPDHCDLLLEYHLHDLENRRQMIDFFGSKKIYISTVSSFYGKWELQQLVDFDTVIVDEASQILEPYLIGLLSRFRKAVLIGDHCQLPAIVTQDKNEGQIEDIDLLEIGLQNLSDSLFERLFLLTVKRGLSHAFDSLTVQGRMHEEIAGFVSSKFYNGQLSCLNGNFKGAERLKATLTSYYPRVVGPGMESVLHKGRLLFIDHPAGGTTDKTNLDEARSAVQIVREYFELKVPEHDRQIGIICPYKAQIALISQMLEDKFPDLFSLVTIDTVERYQGGAREVVILSLCTNHPSQLHTLSQLNRHGLDRKLNVALTRAREQIIILGNADILSANSHYSELIGAAEEVVIPKQRIE